MRTQVSLDAVTPLVNGHHENPFEVLGPHEVIGDGRRGLAVRAFLPDTQQAWLVDGAHGRRRPMRRIHPAGLYEAICPVQDGNQQSLARGNYHFQTTDKHGTEKTMKDPYAFDPLLTDYDLHLLGEGNHWDCYERLGAHIREVDGTTGINFAVWAPNAEGVSVVGEFNEWSGKVAPDAEARPRGCLGTLHSGYGRRHALQVRHQAEGWARRRKVRSVRFRRRGATSHRKHRYRSRFV